MHTEQCTPGPRAQPLFLSLVPAPCGAHSSCSDMLPELEPGDLCLGQSHTYFPSRPPCPGLQADSPASETPFPFSLAQERQPGPQPLLLLSPPPRPTQVLRTKLQAPHPDLRHQALHACPPASQAVALDSLCSRAWPPLCPHQASCRGPWWVRPHKLEGSAPASC